MLEPNMHTVKNVPVNFYTDDPYVLVYMYNDFVRGVRVMGTCLVFAESLQAAIDNTRDNIIAAIVRDVGSFDVAYFDLNGSRMEVGDCRNVMFYGQVRGV